MWSLGQHDWWSKRVLLKKQRIYIYIYIKTSNEYIEIDEELMLVPVVHTQMHILGQKVFYYVLLYFLKILVLFYFIITMPLCQSSST